jgi:hypothetical protein
MGVIWSIGPLVRLGLETFLSSLGVLKGVGLGGFDGVISKPCSSSLQVLLLRRLLSERVVLNLVFFAVRAGVVVVLDR